MNTENVEAALSRVASSVTFSRSDRARALLRYLVTQERDGKAEFLKGFTIAQDVFGKSDDFDPAMDAVVRVQAGRLRDLLATYYADEGRADPLVISIPKGSYVPNYTVMAGNQLLTLSGSGAAPTVSLGERPKLEDKPTKTANTPFDTDVPVSTYVRRNVRSFWYALSAILALLLLLVYLTVSQTGKVDDELTATDQTVPLTARPSLSVLTLDDTNSQYAETIRNAASKFRSIAVRLKGQDETAVASESDYALRIGDRAGDTNDLLLIHTASNELVWEGLFYPEEPSDLARISSVLFSPDGALFRDAKTRNILSPMGQCLATAEQFFSNQTLENFQKAYDCTQALIEQDAGMPSVLAQMGSLLVESAVNGYNIPEGVTMESGIEFAQQAAVNGPDNADAHRALGNALLRQGEVDAGLIAMRRAYEANPFDLAITASYGYAYYLVGDCTQSLSLLQVAIANEVQHPSWWDYTAFLCAFEMNDLETMQSTATALAGYRHSYYLAMRAIVAHLAGDIEMRDRLVAQLGEKETSLAVNPRAFYKRTLPDRLSARMTDALLATGYQPPLGGL